MRTQRHLRWLRLLVIAISLLFLTGLVAVVVTGGYTFTVAGISLSSNSIKPPLIGFLVFAFLGLAISVKITDLALLLGSIVLSLMVTELALRVLDPPQAAPALVHIHQPSTVYSYELIPDSRGIGTLGEEILINSQGARDDEFDPDKLGPKILVVGDSFTFALGVEVEQGFVSQTEARLRASHAGVQVVNLGVIGYSFWQYLEILERRAPAYSADLVIVAMFMDDLLRTKRPERVVPRQPAFVPDKDWSSEFRSVNLLRNYVTLAESVEHAPDDSWSFPSELVVVIVIRAATRVGVHCGLDVEVLYARKPTRLPIASEVA